MCYVLQTVVVFLALATAFASLCQAQSSSATVAGLTPIVIYGRADSLLGAADSASEGVVGAGELGQRPLLRTGEVLETIPGMVVTQHSGPGKANQYFLRGFNLDHGTDFATSVEDMPVNLPSHAHGQGYTDLNFMIPELVRTIEFRKGSYEADQGDFSAAGSADIRYVDALPHPFVKTEAGSYGWGRGLYAGSTDVDDGRLLYALELGREDGPWVRPDDAGHGNAVLRYGRGDAQAGSTLEAMAYKGTWNATDQVAERAIDEGLITRFGSLNTSDGGDSQRYSVSGRWWSGDESGRTEVSAYSYYYDLHLWSDFTYFLLDPVHGDQIEQEDRRVVSGLKAEREWDVELAGRKTVETAGLQVRDDEISNGLLHTEDRQVLSVETQDDVGETSVSPYLESKVDWTDVFRSELGLRGDVYRMNVRSGVTPLDSGDLTPGLFSPKLTLTFGPWDRTECYLDGGYGFHSNDARGATANVNSSGQPISPVTPLVRTVGGEVGVRTLPVSGLQTTLTLWVLKIGSELVWDADNGTDDPSGPSRRYGVEWANYYAPTGWLTLDADASLSRAYFTDDEPAGDYVPEAVETVVAAGAAVKKGPWAAELRERYFGPRALTQDDSIRSKASSLVYLRTAYDLGSSWTVALEVLNLLDSQTDDIEYYYASRLPGEPAAGVNDVHLHPSDPREFRVSLAKRF